MMKIKILDVYEFKGQLRVEVEHEYGKENIGLSLDLIYIGDTGQPACNNQVKELLKKKYGCIEEVGVYGSSESGIEKDDKLHWKKEEKQHLFEGKNNVAIINRMLIQIFTPGFPVALSAMGPNGFIILKPPIRHRAARTIEASIHSKLFGIN